MVVSSGVETSQSTITLLELSVDVIASIVHRLEPQDVMRQLYPVLMSHAECVGVWHKAGAGPSGALYSFRWAANGIDVCELVPSRRYFTHITHRKLCTLNPNNLRYQAAVIDDTKCILRDYGTGFASAASCAVAEAAACVAAGGASSSRSASSSDGALGGSPTSSSWGAELLRFMKQSVQKNRSSRRSRRSGGGSDTVCPVLHHFDRVALRQTSGHPLEGLWKGFYGPHGCELLAIRYDHSGNFARIVATKMRGDPNVPAGQITWRTTAPATTEPWPEAELELVARRPALVAASTFTAAHLAEVDAADEAAGNVIAALIQQQEPPEQAMQLLMTNQHQAHQPQQHPLLGGDAGDAGASQQQQAGSSQPSQGVASGIAELQLQQQRDAAQITARAARLQDRKVIKIIKGQGHVAGHGYTNPGWVQGRLWIYEDTATKEITCGFLFMMDGMLHLVDLERLDGDL
eukprot:gene10766-10922_t